MEYTGYVIDQRIPLTTPEDLNTFLSTGVRENFILDFKRDFPKNLEKTLVAFANTYGGTILIGVDETSTGAAVLPVHGLDLRPGLRERVLQIALDNIYPPLVPDVHVIPIKSSATIADADRGVIVVRVHESDDAPHAVEERTAVYLRVDNISDRFERKATIGEIEWLINKREKSVAEKARILRHVQMHAREYRERRSRRNTGQKPLEKGQIVFYTVPRYPRGQLAEPRQLREIAHSARVQIAVVPSFLPIGSPIPVPQGVLFDESHGTSEFHEQGVIYHSFDFWWESGSVETGTPSSRTVSPSVSAAWMWATLELAAGVYDAVGFGGLVDLDFRFEGVKGALFMNPSIFNNYDPVPIVDDDIGVRRTYSIFTIRKQMLEIVKDCQREMYWNCGVDASDGLVTHDFRRYLPK